MLIFILAISAGMLAAGVFLASNRKPSTSSRILNSDQSTTTTPTSSHAPLTSPTPGKFVTIYINNLDLSVETAKTEAEIHHGLSGRGTIGSDGMLFYIDPPQMVTFWMKEMLFPIDIIWILDGRITGIERTISSPVDQTTALPTYSPPSTVSYVLEVSAGFASEYGIAVGDAVTIPSDR